MLHSIRRRACALSIGIIAHGLFRIHPNPEETRMPREKNPSPRPPASARLANLRRRHQKADRIPSPVRSALIDERRAVAERRRNADSRPATKRPTGSRRKPKSTRLRRCMTPRQPVDSRANQSAPHNRGPARSIFAWHDRADTRRTRAARGYVRRRRDHGRSRPHPGVQRFRRRNVRLSRRRRARAQRLHADDRGGPRRSTTTT